MNRIETYNNQNFQQLCRQLAKRDRDLHAIVREFGYPPLWTRPATFQTLVLTILEQQISLASAYAAFKRLKDKIGYVTPLKILAMTGEELRACSFSRQKIIYVRDLAAALTGKQLKLKAFTNAHEDQVRVELKKIKGIGDWTVDVYLMHALQRLDLFPLGDIALVNSLKFIKNLPANLTREEMLTIAERWRPYRTIASMLLWHAYIKRRGIVLRG